MEDFKTWTEVVDYLLKVNSETEEYDIRFNGSGDSFNEFYNYDIADDVFSAMDKLIWKLIDDTDANFNNDGCEGTITINTKERKVTIDIRHYVETTEQGDIIELEDL